MAIENIYNAVEKLRSTTKENQNQNILTVVMHCIASIDNSLPVSRESLFRICTKGGLTQILRDAAKTADAFGGELQKAADECVRLEKAAEASQSELNAITNENKKKSEIQKRLDTIRRDIETAQAAQYKYDEFMVELRKLGIDTSNMGAPDFASKTQNLLRERVTDYESKTAALNDTVHRASQARAKFERAKQESSNELVKIYEECATSLQEYAGETKNRLSDAELSLEQTLKQLDELRNNLEMATSRRMDAEKEIKKYMAAFKAHQAENNELYNALYSHTKTEGIGELIEKFQSCNSTLDAAFSPYEKVLRLLMAQSQEALNASIARIEGEYKIDLSRSKKD